MTVDADQTGITRRLRSIPRPKPVLSRDRERALSRRQRDLLDQLEHLLFAEGFAELTMANLAARLNCSLRTLYAVAPSRDELVLIVVDRNLWRVGHAARAAVTPDMAPMAALREYLRAASDAVSERTEPFARDLGAVPSAHALAEGHRRYLFEVIQALLDEAAERGDIAPVDTAAVARILAGLASVLSSPEVIPTLRSSPKDAMDEVADLILRGLRSEP
ncbi:TetR/AcrR family transcriptional regulator [Pseudofrankia inefficax]|uniref:Regulatory protein TetR n=1 Tax=Pseudofrankia inefficax (strain DSM 45817 / CECT 9037 / DDB 130130 / EuI1c) TaxID=298654 RepID=E3J925_PSEI1|nr:TetR family transcriptional regulator [Pseudofrankia inefficax]ADP80904.1 regulatory protein TetR [Pseudofrankia inefficax]